MDYQIALLGGDGIGPEVTGEAKKVLEAIENAYGHTFSFQEAIIGGGAIDAVGDPLPEETLEVCRASDAVLFGAVGGPKWDDPSADVRPEQGLLDLRKELGLFANLRPIKLSPALIEASTIKADVLRGTDLLVVRELTGGIYFGERGRRDNGTTAYDTMIYSENEIERVLRVAFDLARKRRKHVTSVDKANVLEVSRLWRETATRVAQDYTDIAFENVFIDACAMRLIQRPASFDVIVTGNMFGDIITDEASMLAGSLGMLPSASLAQADFGLFEPIHGTAPDIAGKGIANPIGAIYSAAMLLRYALNLDEEAEAIEKAVDAVLADGYRTADIAEKGAEVVGTQVMGDLIAESVKA